MHSVKKVNLFILYSLSYVLLMEWLLPLPYITDTGYIFVFVVATFFFFLINFLQLPSLVVLLLKIVIIYVGLHYIFFEGPVWQMQSYLYVMNDLFENFIYISSGQILQLTDLFRSLLFFVLLAAMSYLLHYWIVHVKRIFIFLLLTVVFVTILDTFTAYDATLAIIRIFVIGFLLLGFVRIIRKMEESDVVVRSKWLFSRLLLSLTSVILLAGLLGIAGPKFEPQWADPVPFLISATGLDSSLVRQKIGYGDNDEQLGGGFVYDDTPVFYANVEKPHYYRGETKNYYSGKGWEVTTPAYKVPAPYSTLNFDVERVEREAEIHFTGKEHFEHIFYPGDVSYISTVANVPLTLLLDIYTLKGIPYFNQRQVELEEYVLTYQDSKFSIESLRLASNDDPEEIREYYLQLPEELPERIRELTEEIIANYDNRYDQVKAVERYLSGADFSYETKNVAIPKEDEDYVDQFLFETRVGYCDNFSTAMAVMLRTVNIPTRWVKGFTEGELIAADGNISQYLITNANAHSWVEVYFPEHGWVPFEPTKGFSNSTAFTFEYPTSEGIDWEKQLDTNESEEQTNELEQKEETERNEAKGNTNYSFHLPVVIVVLLAITFIAVMIVFKSSERRKRMTFSIKKPQKAHTFEERYNRLLYLLEKKGKARLKGETLREYAIRIDKMYGTKDMQQLTEKYEQLSYGRVEEFVLTKEEAKLLQEMETKIRS